MLQGVRSVVRTSWVSVTLAAALGVTMPLAATMAGTALATPIAVPSAAVSVVVETHPGAVHDAAPTYDTQAIRHRGAHAGRRAGGSAPPKSDRRTGWDRASVLVHVPAGGLTAHRNPWSSSPAIGRVAATSKYYGVPIVIRLDAVNAAGTWGRVELPYVWPRRDGWIALDHLVHEQTFIHVDVDLSEHRVRVYKRDELLYTVPSAIGTPSSPTPPGHYVVTDRVPFPAGSALGSFAFGISGIQPHLPAGWSGGNQLAIHGTNDSSSIGTSASAGCVRVSEWALAHFEPLLRLGTPVVIHG
jgi:lipoprotein-anchoring transpeptidase ErfK/SrfK